MKSLGRCTAFFLCVLLGESSTAGSTSPHNPGERRSEGGLVTDGSVGPAVDLSDGDQEIPASLGSQRGANLFHSFSDFNVAPETTVTFTAEGALAGVEVDHVITRVTGGDVSNIDGTIASTIGEDSFVFINPAGVHLGSNGKLDVNGSLYLSTADVLELADGTRLSAGDPRPSPLLTSAPPAAFGFLDAHPASVTLKGRLEVDPELKRNLGVIGGDLWIEGGFLAAPDGDVSLISVGSPGIVRGPLAGESRFSLDGFEHLGAIELRGDAIVSSSAVDGLGANLLELVASDLQAGGNEFGSYIYREAGSDPPQTFGIVALGQLFTNDVPRFDVYFSPKERQDGAGNVFIRGGELLVEDSEIRAVTAGRTNAGEIDIRVSGTMTLDEEAGILAGSGVEIAGTTPPLALAGAGGGPFQLQALLGGDGDGGDVHVEAKNVRILAGARISSTSFSRGRGGDVSVNAEEVVIDGKVDPQNVSAIFSNAQGTGEGGRVAISADALRLSDGGGVFAATNRDAPAGRIDVTVKRLEIAGTSQIDSSTGDPNLVRITEGAGGDIRVVAKESISITGENARIGAFAEATSSGRAGTITIETPTLELADGGEIVVRADGDGNAGDVTVLVGESLQLNDSRITADAGSGTGGNIRINPIELVGEDGQTHPTMVGPAGVVTLQQSEIVAQAGEGMGGEITIRTDLFLEDPPSLVDASAENPTLSGTVTIDAPEVDLSASLAPLPESVFVGDALVPERCAARATAVSTFVVGGRDGVPARPEGLLPAPFAEARRDPRVEEEPDESQRDHAAIGVLETMNLASLSSESCPGGTEVTSFSR